MSAPAIAHAIHRTPSTNVHDILRASHDLETEKEDDDKMQTVTEAAEHDAEPSMEHDVMADGQLTVTEVQVDVHEQQNDVGCFTFK